MQRCAEVETSRLRMLRPRLADVPSLFRFLGDARAMQFTHVDASPRQCRKRVAAHEWYRRRDGFAPWTVQRKSDDAVIGWGGLYNDPFDPGWGPEVGYFFDPSAWGQGYASELVAACTELADRRLGLRELTAFAHPDNAGSRRVLEKAGFAVVRFVPEMQRWLFRRVARG